MNVIQIWWFPLANVLFNLSVINFFLVQRVVFSGIMQVLHIFL